MDPDRPDTPSEHPLAHRASPYPMSRLAPRFDLVDLAAEIARADELLSTVASAKLDVIREQMRTLQEQARTVLEHAALASKLHRARCNFRKVPGHVYHLYRRSGDELYFSMLSPEDWGGKPPHPFEGAYRLELDQTFTRVDGEEHQPPRTPDLAR